MSDEIVLDGSQGEGGGQILRSSLALSMATGKPFRPGPMIPGEYRFSVGTPGSTTLIFQTLMTALILTGKPFEGKAPISIAVWDCRRGRS